ncbi:LysR family transcriptional regulator [Pseudomonas sp. CCM 7891]|uniref:LysR family transcriptional regulator n=1 Tax=Pseudomonas karstica TaxID=1055468 RepID=A0A7X2UX68_9PSED|nr:LysR family transcriptional regulator [Pseudomonas karstica]MTD18133.1 LysR family transcriptional regulator [Pseudomonas karstica]
MDQIDAIKLFIRVVERGGFSAAAREAGVGQSAVSKQIAALEERLGATLLLRTSRSLRVTEAGQRFYSSALQWVGDYTDMVAAVADSQAAPSGNIRIAVAPVFGRLYVVPHLASFFERYPGINVETTVSDRHANLIEEGVDFAIRHGELEDSSLTARRLATSPLVTVASLGYLQRHGEPVTPNDLQQHGCILFSGREETRPWRFVDMNATSITLRPEGRFCSNDGEQIRTAVLGHIGIAQVPAWLVMPELISGQLRAILPNHATGEVPISAVYPSRRVLTHKARLLIELLSEMLNRDLRAAITTQYPL